MSNSKLFLMLQISSLLLQLQQRIVTANQIIELTHIRTLESIPGMIGGSLDDLQCF